MSPPTTRFPSRGERLGRLLERLPASVLRQLAERQARTLPLGLQPGWYFGLPDEDRSAATSFRRELSDWFRDRPRSGSIVIPWYEGLRIRLYLGNDLSHCLYIGGSFEPNEFVLLHHLLKPGMVVIDGGANDGLYSLFTARRVGSEGRVLAVEPSGRERHRLEANIALNRLGNIEVLDVALGAERGSAELAIAEDGHEGQNTIGARVSNPTVATARRETVSVVSIDDLVSERALAHVDVIKLDVEGSEVAALQGAAETIARSRPVIVIEAEEERLRSQGATLSELLELLDAFGYSVFVFDSLSGQLRPAADADVGSGNVVAAPRGWAVPIL